jgi:hypothetical protein
MLLELLAADMENFETVLVLSELKLTISDSILSLTK